MSSMHGSRAKLIRVNARIRSDCFGGIQRRVISLREYGIEAVTDDCDPRSPCGAYRLGRMRRMQGTDKLTLLAQ